MCAGGWGPSLLGREAGSPGPLLLLHVNDLPLSRGANSDAGRAVKREVMGEGSRPSARRQGRVSSVVTGEPLPGLGASSGFWDHLLTQDQSCHGFQFFQRSKELADQCSQPIPRRLRVRLSDGGGGKGEVLEPREGTKLF